MAATVIPSFLPGARRAAIVRASAVSPTSGRALMRPLARGTDEAAQQEAGCRSPGQEPFRPAASKFLGIDDQTVEALTADRVGQAIDLGRCPFGIACDQGVVALMERISGLTQRIGDALHRLGDPAFLLVYDLHGRLTNLIGQWTV